MPDTVAPPRPESATFQVDTESMPLEQVLVHTPGHEMELVAPDNRLDLLFDDILFLGNARDEHLLMCTLFEKVVDAPGAVLQVSELLLDVFQQEDARADFIDRLCRVMPETNIQAVRHELKQLAPSELHSLALTGESPLPLRLPPLPNLMFTRDLAAVVHDRIVISHAATAARSRESIIMQVLLHHHRFFNDVKDRVITLPEGVTFEGGDLLMAAPDVLLIGHSERTSFGAIMAIAHQVFEHTPIEHVLAVDLPKRRSTMHLDTVFTFASPNECVAFPPLVDDPSYGYAVHLTEGSEPGQFITDMRPNLCDVLNDLIDRDLTFIPCGGPDRINQEREQWTDGANVFAVAPGVIVGYERNRRTFEELRNHGYRVVSAENFLSYYQDSTFTPGDEKLAIQLAGTELSRGRGGPRCMTLPLARTSIHDM
ncbi:arginine deiminase [Longimonas halophila]|uniref:arginine deiminase n=1 Tax=Longimonas halophila TaxID=1469170 RepID=A0A2H3NML0_9BACT|nr:arginine deiminase family protein [Longimonas halophila]PEN06013.1 arginine deiminase [Longimonas halophila]